ncbi:MAG: cation diffusion facilitator family transporter [Rickettsiales bacterium]
MNVTLFYGAEIYFWSFVVAILVFAVGSGVSLYEGIHKLSSPEEISNPMINYIVLGIAMIFEAGAWWIAYREFKLIRGEMGTFEAVRRSKDPALFTVLFEDSAAMLGLIVAFIGIAIAHHTGAVWADGAASIVIGLILAGTATILAYETKGLLIGEGASKTVRDSIINIIKSQKEIEGISELRTMHLGPDDILVVAGVDFTDDISVEEMENTISLIEVSIKKDFPEIKRVFIEAQSKL